MGNNYDGLPYTVAVEWGRVLQIPVHQFESVKQMVDYFSNDDDNPNNEYGVYLVQGLKQSVGHYHFRHPQFLNAQDEASHKNTTYQQP